MDNSWTQDMRFYTRLLTNDQTDFHTDELGNKHEDDMYQSEEDGDIVEDMDTIIEKDVVAREASAINPSWNVVEECDPSHMNSCQNWNATDQYVEGGEFACDQHFSSLDELKRQLTIYFVARGKEYTVKVAKEKYYTVICKLRESCNCPWKLTAARVHENLDLWRISRYSGPHIPTCVRDVMHVDSSNVSAAFICGEIISLIRADKTIKPLVIIAFMSDKYNVQVSYKKAWDAKQRAISSIYGD